VLHINSTVPPKADIKRQLARQFNKKSAPSGAHPKCSAVKLTFRVGEMQAEATIEPLDNTYGETVTQGIPEGQEVRFDVLLKRMYPTKISSAKLNGTTAEFGFERDGQWCPCVKLNIHEKPKEILSELRRTLNQGTSGHKGSEILDLTF
jgi:hypothetical protein